MLLPQTGSIAVQSELQFPAPGPPKGASHSSSPSSTPSPHSMSWQEALQVTPSAGSHSSPGCTTPLPHSTSMFWQVELQITPSGGSHSSPLSVSMLPSPQTAVGSQLTTVWCIVVQLPPSLMLTVIVCSPGAEQV